MAEELAVKYISPRKLNPYKNNARRHSEHQVRQIMESMKEFGFLNPIIVGKKNTVLAGHGRLEAARRLELKTVPIIEVGHLSDRQQRAFILADNKIGDNSQWDRELLSVEIDKLVGEGFSVELTGFDEGELDALLKDADDILPDTIPTAENIDPVHLGRSDEDDEAPESAPVYDTSKAISKRGQIWQLGEHRLMCGDCTNRDDVKELLAKFGTPDAIITDPPYCSGGFNESQKAGGSIGSDAEDKWGGKRPEIANDTLSARGYQALLKSAFTQFRGKIVYCFTDWRMWAVLFDLVESCGYNVKSMIVWNKGTPGMGQGWRTQHELIMLGVNGKVRFNMKNGHANVITAKRSGNKFHPTQKPVPVMAQILKVSEMVKSCYDPFTGSGTTLIACEEAQPLVRFFGMELTPYFVDQTIDRWQKLTGRDAVLIETGDTFNKLRDAQKSK